MSEFTPLREAIESLASRSPAPDFRELERRATRRGRRRVAIVAAAVAAVIAGSALTVRGLDGSERSAPPVIEQPKPTSTPAPGTTLPIQYPVGQELRDLGDTPGPLAAIWLTPRAGGGSPEVVGMVAETGKFGTLPIHVSSSYMAPDSYFALSPDGRRIAYDTPAEELTVRDLVSGESYSPTFKFKPRPERWYTWIDATHLVGHDVRGSESDGWVWQPGTAPKVVSILKYVGTPYLGPYAGRDPWFNTLPDDPRKCLSLQDQGAGKPVPLLCDVVGVIGDQIALTHDGDGATVALDVRGVEDPALRQVVATAGAPMRVTFATDLIGEALDADGGAS